MRQTFTTIGELVGGLLIACGCALIAAPLGLLSAGALLILFSWLASHEGPAQ